MALLGVLVGQLTIIVNERWKARRDDRRKWHDERLKVYYDLVHEATQLRDKVDGFMREGPKHTDLGIDSSEGVSRLVDKARLISSQPVYRAAQGLWAELFMEILEIIRTFEDAIPDLSEEDRARMMESGAEF